MYKGWKVEMVVMARNNTETKKKYWRYMESWVKNISNQIGGVVMIWQSVSSIHNPVDLTFVMVDTVDSGEIFATNVARILLAVNTDHVSSIARVVLELFPAYVAWKPEGTKTKCSVARLFFKKLKARPTGSLEKRGESCVFVFVDFRSPCIISFEERKETNFEV